METYAAFIYVSLISKNIYLLDMDIIIIVGTFVPFKYDETAAHSSAVQFNSKYSLSVKSNHDRITFLMNHV